MAPRHGESSLLALALANGVCEADPRLIFSNTKVADARAQSPRPAIAEAAGDQQGSLDAPTQDPAGLKTLVLPNLPPSRHSPIPIAAEKSALRRNFESPTKEENCFPKAVLKGCRRNTRHEQH